MDNYVFVFLYVGHTHIHLLFVWMLCYQMDIRVYILLYMYLYIHYHNYVFGSMLPGYMNMTPDARNDTSFRHCHSASIHVYSHHPSVGMV